MPNPLPTGAPNPTADITRNGGAASVHGSAAAGQVVFDQHCAVCHGPAGKGGVPNPGSDDGAVPPLNPIDPRFNASANGDPAAFAREIDRFIQHGSRPTGPNPEHLMPAWGDQQSLTQQQVADVEAYVIRLNGLSWPVH
jgi:mono/diheme cytochrome c family protein